MNSTYIHFTNTLHTLSTHFTYTLHTLYTHCTNTVHTLYMHCTYTFHTLYIQFTYMVLFVSSHLYCLRYIFLGCTLYTAHNSDDLIGKKYIAVTYVEVQSARAF